MLEFPKAILSSVLYVFAVYWGILDAVFSLVFRREVEPTERCTICYVKSTTAGFVGQRLAQARQWFPRAQTGGSQESSNTCPDVTQSHLQSREVELDDDNDDDIDEEYYDEVEPPNQSQPKQKSYQVTLASTFSVLKRALLNPWKSCGNVVSFGGKIYRRVRHSVVCQLQRRVIAPVRKVSTLAADKCRATLGLNSTLSAPKENAGFSGKEKLSAGIALRKMGSEILRKTSSHLPAPGKNLVDAMSDILDSSQAIRREVSDPLRGPLDMRTDCPVFLDRLALAAFRTGNWLLGLRSTEEEEIAFLDGYHGHLQQMQMRARNIDYNCTMDEIRAPQGKAALLIDLDTQVTELTEHRSTIV
ncbi:uncharacterized protein [Diadema setosum]|uniref:uncharacterized protein n=1 Tax=Diadema setosum TaxID=31175 RepID=UPI003B3B65A1